MFVETGQRDAEPLGERGQGEAVQPDLVGQPGRLLDHDRRRQPGPRHGGDLARERDQGRVHELRVLRLRVVPGVGHHQELAVQGVGHEPGLGRGVGPVLVLGAHHDQHRRLDLAQPGLGRGVAGAGGLLDRPPVRARDLADVLGQVGRRPARVGRR
jgi:hypothetical protein